MRILFHIIDMGKGGTETALIGWLQALSAAGHSPGLVVSYPTPELDELYRAQLPAGLPVHILQNHPLLHTLHGRRRRARLHAAVSMAKSVLSSTVNRLWARLRMRKIAAQYDVIVDFDLSLRYLAGSFQRPWMGVSHFSFDARLKGRPAKIARLGRQYHAYDAIAVLNGPMAREASALFGAQIRKLLLLPNTVDVDDLRRRAALPLPALPGRPGPWLSATPFIVSVARLDEGQKDHATLIAAYAALIADGLADVDLVIIGDGPDRANVAALARASPVAARIHLAGFQANPYPIVARASLLVLSSRYEGFGMVLLEAMALGKPVVSSDCPNGPADVLDGGRAGLLVPPGDSVSMSRAFATLLNDARQCALLQEGAQQRLAYYGGAASAARMAQYCRDLIRW